MDDLLVDRNLIWPLSASTISFTDPLPTRYVPNLQGPSASVESSSAVVKKPADQSAGSRAPFEIVWLIGDPKAQTPSTYTPARNILPIERLRQVIRSPVGRDLNSKISSGLAKS